VSSGKKIYINLFKVNYVSSYSMIYLTALSVLLAKEETVLQSMIDKLIEV
jgi:hypothetical protein